MDRMEGWVPKNWFFQIVVLQKTLGSPLDSKEIKPVNPKGKQPWIFIGRTDTEVIALKFWPPDVKSWLTGKDPDSGKDWGQEEKGVTVDEMSGWHHRLSGHGFEQTQWDNEVQGNLACYSSWGANIWTRLSDWTTTTFGAPLLWELAFGQAPTPPEGQCLCGHTHIHVVVFFRFFIWLLYKEYQSWVLSPTFIL